MVESLAPMWEEERQRCGGTGPPPPPPDPPRDPQELCPTVAAIRAEFQACHSTTFLSATAFMLTNAVAAKELWCYMLKDRRVSVEHCVCNRPLQTRTLKTRRQPPEAAHSLLFHRSLLLRSSLQQMPEFAVLALLRRTACCARRRQLTASFLWRGQIAQAQTLVQGLLRRVLATRQLLFPASQRLWAEKPTPL